MSNVMSDVTTEILEKTTTTVKYKERKWMIWGSSFPLQQIPSVDVYIIRINPFDIIIIEALCNGDKPQDTGYSSLFLLDAFL